MDEWCFRLSRYSKFLFRRWLTSMFTSVSFWKIAAMLVQSSTSFRRGGWGVSSLILCTHRDSVSKMALLWVFLFRPWLTIFLFWNIALTFKLRQVPPRYSGFQSLFSCQHGKLWFVRGGRGWHGGIGMMNDEKDGMVEKACTVWSALGRELRLCLEITKVIRTITESLFSVQA